MDAHIFYVLEAVAQIADKGVVDMFEHTTLSDDVPYGLGSNDCSGAPAISVTPPARQDRGVTSPRNGDRSVFMTWRTFIFAYILEGEG